MSDGRTAILTGVTGGWGRAVLDLFCERGWNVTATRRGPAEELPDGVLGVEADLTDPGLGAGASSPRRSSGSAGSTRWPTSPGGSPWRGPIEDTPPELFDRQMALNFDTALNMTRAVLPGMKEHGSGSIVYIGTSAATSPFAGGSAYALSKMALRGLMRVVDVENRTARHPRQRAGREDRRHAAQPRREPRRRLLRAGRPARSSPRRSSGSARTRRRRSREAASPPMAAPDSGDAPSTCSPT